MWPHERSLVKQMENKPFALIGVNIGAKDPSDLGKIMATEKLPWRSLWNGPYDAPNSLAKNWNVTGTPTVFLIDHQGVIRHKYVGGPDDRVLDEALAPLVQAAEDARRKQ